MTSYAVDLHPRPREFPATAEIFLHSATNWTLLPARAGATRFAGGSHEGAHVLRATAYDAATNKFKYVGGPLTVPLD